MKHPRKNIILIYGFFYFIHLFILLLVLFQFTYGVNAWRHWVVGKNAELEKARSQGKYIKPFETDILKLRADELNYTLCMFVKEVKKPNGEPYASDSIFYLTLGIQVCICSSISYFTQGHFFYKDGHFCILEWSF